MNKPLISVIVPVYKVERYLDECVESIVNQTYHNLEIILVDDGSPDNCPQICDDWAKKDERIRVIHKENGGLSSARNAGLDICTGDYISFIDSDDWIESDFYYTLYRKSAESGAEIVMCAAVAEYPDGSSRNTAEHIFSHVLSQDELLHDFLYHRNNVCGAVWDKLYKRSVFEKVRFPIGLNSEDRYVHAITYSSISKFQYIDVILYHYRQRENSICTTRELSSHTFDQVETSRMACNYLNEKKKITKEECNYFLMIAYHDVLRNLVLCNASSELIRQYTRELRGYYWSTIKDSNVSVSFKCKLTLFCIAPRVYEKLKGKLIGR